LEHNAVSLSRSKLFSPSAAEAGESPAYRFRRTLQNNSQSLLCAGYICFSSCEWEKNPGSYSM